MKYKLLFGFGILCILSVFFVSARFHRGEISYSVTDSDREYTIKAKYGEGAFNKVRDYLDKKLGRYTALPFEGAEIDGDITLDNGASFYLLLKPGRLHIKLNKQKNSESTYQHFSQMGRELKNVMGLQ